MGSITFRFTCGLLINCLVVVSLAVGQSIPRTSNNSNRKVDPANISAYLIDMSERSAGDSAKVFEREAGQIAKVIWSPNRKSAVVIDDGATRELVVQAAAQRLAESPLNKTLVKINWNALFAAAKTDHELNHIFGEILQFANASKERIVLFIDDISGLSMDRPMFGNAVAQSLSKAIADQDLQTVSAATPETYAGQITPNVQLSK